MVLAQRVVYPAKIKNRWDTAAHREVVGVSEEVGAGMGARSNLDSRRPYSLK